ncbi:hypothetical protein B296_00020272 [Ensete ventricosum]|uniref:Uncharacterized protein n=1 Tax=Ensete ventricosum TaxID=4639 RepID=A0A427A8A3_ENSVE|nr:hypothetical protein B296_00020272 [Ensete ventricosum]
MVGVEPQQVGEEGQNAEGDGKVVGGVHAAVLPQLLAAAPHFTTPQHFLSLLHALFFVVEDARCSPHSAWVQSVSGSTFQSIP